MYQNNPSQNNLNLNNNTGFNSYSQSPTDMIQMEQSDYSDYFSATDDNIASTSYTTYTTSNYEQQEQQQPEYSMFSFVNNEHANSTTQPLSSQHTLQNPSSTPLNSLNTMIAQSEIFRFEIPGFRIIVIPTSSPFANLTDLDAQNLVQPDYTNYSNNIFTDNLQQQNSNESFNFNNFSG